MTEDVFNTLEQLKGKTKKYNGKEITINGFKEVHENIVVFTNKQTYNFLPHEIHQFFDDLKEPKPKKDKKFMPTTTNQNNVVKTEPNQIVVNGYRPSKENMQLKESLMDILKDIKESPTKQNIEKARAICNVANTVVNIQKAEIQLINTLKRQ